MQNPIFDFSIFDTETSTKSAKEKREYLDKFFVPLKDGNYAFLDDDGKYKILNDTTVSKVYLNRLPNEFRKYVLKECTNIRKPVYELNKPTFYDNCINFMPQLMHTYEKDYEPTEQVKEQLDVLLNYIKEIYCNNIEEQYNFFLKWNSNLVRGSKNVVYNS